MTEKLHPLGKRLFKLINNEVIFGECEYVEYDDGRPTDIRIKTPFTAKNGNIMPYMTDVLTSAPAAIQIHPMNVLWSTPLNEFKVVDDAYLKATTRLDLSASSLR